MATASEYPSSLTSWLDYLENRHQEIIQLGLERSRVVASSLSLTTFDVPVITVSGTNGKGSTVLALEAMYREVGYRVASYTSPHLLMFNERIRMDGVPASDDALCKAFSAVHAVPDSRALTYFEMTTLAAFWLFRAYSPDVIILEVGMGGRLDATNLIDADVAIMTTVDLDHQAWLGQTRDEIGYEKAGIFRSEKPAIYADDHPPDAVLKYAQTHRVPLLRLNKDYFFCSDKNEFVVSFSENHWRLPYPQLNTKAVAAALVAVKLLHHILPVSMEDMVHALQNAHLQGRQQCMGSAIKTILDVAHNPQAVRLLAEYMRKNVLCGRVHAVFSGLKDKDLSGLIKPMKSMVDAWYPALLSGARASDEALLCDAFDVADVAWPGCFLDPMAAYDAAMQNAKIGDWVVVYGSFLTVGAVLEHIKLQEEG